ncbi:hypothetical protein EN816_32320 [Mesorhizobium sp. M8A.F.Ca.ET.173.01.1.1]|nr:hypothetical protein EN816_32320 [Mesorhizobium sp. M8A.F.Ca.ET.173.01.1.1]
MATAESMPGYLDAMSDESLWRRMQLRFDAYSSLFDMRLETETEAVGHEETSDNKKVWISDAPRWDGHRAWLLLPYIDALDQARLQEQIDIGRALVQSIRQRLHKRELSPSFLRDWGQFCAAAGLVEFVYFSKTSNGHRRSALGGGRARIDGAEAHQRWFAHYFLQQYRRGRRKEAEKAFERLVNAIIEDRIAVPAGWDVKWFEGYLTAPNYTELKPAFDEHSLSVRHMRELAAIGIAGIPPVDLEIPDP